MIIDAAREKILRDQESRALYCALHSKAIAFDLIESLHPVDFYFEGTKNICRAIIKCSDDGDSISPGGIKRHLKYKQDLDLLDNIQAMPDVDPAEFKEFVSYIRENSRLRRLDMLCVDIKSKLTGEEESDNLISEMMSELVHITVDEHSQSFADPMQLFDETLSEMKDRSSTGVLGYSTGLKSLDEAIGGWQGSKLYIIAGRTGMCKTTMAIFTACRVAYRDKIAVPFFSIEMPKKEVQRKLISSLTGVEHWRIEKRLWRDEDIHHIEEHRERIGGMPWYINDSGSITLSEIIAKVKALKIKEGKLGPIFIDYLQLMKILIPRGGNRDQAIGEVTRALKRLSKDLDVPVILLSQVRRAVEERENKRPMLSDLRESGNIEQDADVVIFFYRDHYYTDDPSSAKDCEAIVAKQRGGPTGTCYIKLDIERNLFYEGDVDP
jgi:replicative DNA helicase